MLSLYLLQNVNKKYNAIINTLGISNEHIS